MGGEVGTGGSGTGGSSGTGGGSGAGGKAGAGGTAGAGGSAGASGNAGASGRSGAGGQAGAGGSGGAGAGGVAGTSGTSGTAGAGGAGSGCVTGNIRVDYANNNAGNQITYDMNVVNVGSSGIALSNLEIRYYFTQENAGTSLVPHPSFEQLQNPFVDISSTVTITTSEAAMSTTTSTADHYFATTFAGSTTLAPNQYLAFETYFLPGNQTQTNDYSYGSQTVKQTWNKIVVLVSGVQQWGCTP